MSGRLGSAALGALLALGCAPPGRAAFGFGDVVYDPANTAQTINLLRQAQQEYDLLGTLLGVSTRQFDRLLQLASAVGQAGGFASALSPAELQAVVRSVPGLQGADLGALFDANGLLDAFLGVPLDQWALAVEQPTAFFRDILVDPAIARIGAAAGLSSPSIAYAQWYAALSPEDRANLGPRAAADLSDLMAGAWLEGAKTRRVNFEGLAAASQAAGNLAQQAGTVLDGQRAQAQLGSASNAILLEAAAQGAAASETVVRALQAQNQLLRDEGDGLRDAEEMRLDGSE